MTIGHLHTHTHMSTLYNLELSNLVISTDDDVHKGGETNPFDKLYSALSTIRQIIRTGVFYRKNVKWA